VVGYPVIRSRNLNFYSEIGFDWINGETSIDFSPQLSGPFSEDRLRVLHVSGIVDFRDSWRGSSQVRASVRQGLPIFNSSREGDSMLSRPDGTAVFTSLRGEVWRLQPLIDELAFFGRVAGQYAFDKLLVEEEAYAGALQFGRGYDPKEISGDSGVGFTGELQYTYRPEWQYLERVQVFGFYDLGRVWDRGQSSTVSSLDLSSAGGGIRAWPFPEFAMEIMVAKPLTKPSLRADSTKDPQVLFRTFLRF
jgi:hemolysin activation/secretion protein